MYKIKTQLVDRETEFKILAIAYESGVPVLFSGQSGTAKTQLFFDFTSSLGLKGLFRQLSYDTRKEEFYGYIDPVALTQKGELKRIGGLDETVDALLVDEVDKANSQNRNLLLSILRERKIFDGSRIRDLKNLKLIVGTTNTEIKEALSEAFLDRFVIKANIYPLGFEKLFGKKLEEYELEIVEVQEKEDISQIYGFITAAVKQFEISLSDRTVVTLNHLLPYFVKYLEGYELYRVIGQALLNLDPTQLKQILPPKLSILSEIEKGLQDLQRVKDPVKRSPIQANLINLANELKKLGMEEKANEIIQIIATYSV